MHRRLLVSASLALASCAPAADARPFNSDRISVETRGGGPDVILVPGVAVHRDVWSGTADSLDGEFRVHLVQVNGFGGIAPAANAEGAVAAPVAEEIARYIREARLRSPTIVGHSMGGAIGMMLAARHPDLVGRLMVLDEPPFLGAVFAPPNAPPDSIRAVADRLRAGFLAAPADGPTMFEQMIPTMTRSDSARAVLLRYARASHQPTIANAMHELIVTDLRPELARIRAPVWVLYVHPVGVPLSAEQYDSVMKSSYANARGVRLVRIDGSNHYIQIDQPGRVVAEIRSFIAADDERGNGQDTTPGEP